MLYPLVYIGLFFHAPTFWKWVLLPGTLFVIELLFKYLSGSAYGRGTQILELIALPHGVTRLCIAKPGNWNFNAGEYAFLRYPTLSSFEWHPFTISSAPETEGVVGFHIRSLGNWTTALYNLAKSKPIDDYSHEYMYETENQDDEKDEENLDRSSSGTAALSKSKRNFTSSDNFNSWNKIYILGPYHSTACDAMLEAEHASMISLKFYLLFFYLLFFYLLFVIFLFVIFLFAIFLFVIFLFVIFLFVVFFLSFFLLFSFDWCWYWCYTLFIYLTLIMV